MDISQAWFSAKNINEAVSSLENQFQALPGKSLVGFFIVDKSRQYRVDIEMANEGDGYTCRVDRQFPEGSGRVSRFFSGMKDFICHGRLLRRASHASRYEKKLQEQIKNLLSQAVPQPSVNPRQSKGKGAEVDSSPNEGDGTSVVPTTPTTPAPTSPTIEVPSGEGASSNKMRTEIVAAKATEAAVQGTGHQAKAVPPAASPAPPVGVLAEPAAILPPKKVEVRTVKIRVSQGAAPVQKAPRTVTTMLDGQRHWMRDIEGAAELLQRDTVRQEIKLLKPGTQCFLYLLPDSRQFKIGFTPLPDYAEAMACQNALEADKRIRNIFNRDIQTANLHAAAYNATKTAVSIDVDRLREKFKEFYFVKMQSAEAMSTDSAEAVYSELLADFKAEVEYIQSKLSGLRVAKLPVRQCIESETALIDKLAIMAAQLEQWSRGTAGQGDYPGNNLLQWLTELSGALTAHYQALLQAETLTNNQVLALPKLVEQATNSVPGLKALVPGTFTCTPCVEGDARAFETAQKFAGWLNAATTTPAWAA